MDSLGQLRVPDVADLERQLAEFWREASSEDQAVTRACAINLVVACEGSAAVAGVTRTLASLSERHPARALVVAVDDAGAPGVPDGAPDAELTAFVSAHCHRGPGGARVCSEQITLECRGSGARLVPETVVQLLVGDCPVFTWWHRPELGADPLWSPLARLADRFIVDSARFSQPVQALAELAALVAGDGLRADLGDLAWVRQAPWRELVASLFDSSLTRGYLDCVTAVEVGAGGPASPRGVTVAGAYLAGWLASRLGWRRETGPGVLRRPDAGRVVVGLVHDRRLEPGRISSVKIECADAERPATFVVERPSPAEDAVRLRMETEGACPLPYSQKLARRDDLSALCGELERDREDPIFEEALAAAAGLFPDR